MRVAVVGAVVVAVVVVVGGAGCPSGRLSAGGRPAPKHDGDTGENDNPLGPNGYRLPDHTGILSQHTYFDGTYQKVGFIYKTALFQVTDAQLLFQDDNAFPRPPLSAQFAWRGPGDPFDFDAVAVHLKAGEAAEDSQR